MNDSMRAVRVWDLPTRVFHWALAACVIGSLVSAKVGGNAMAWHFRFGYAVFALLLFRLVWGVIGGRWSRFANFVPSPGAAWAYLRRQGPVAEQLEGGHNPMGALSVLAMIALLAAQVGTGLFADDEIANRGPLINLVSNASSSLLSSWHKTFGQWLVLSLVSLHVVAILFYLLKKRQNLIGPMLGGDKLLSTWTPGSADGWQQRLIAALLLSACAALVAWVLQLGQAAVGAAGG